MILSLSLSFIYMQVCIENEPGVFFILLPSLYRYFSKHLFGCQDVLYLIVSNIDPAQVCAILSYTTHAIYMQVKLHAKIIPYLAMYY